jgi:hypothetical protein
VKHENLLGGSWLAANYDINPVMPLQTLSCIGGRRSSKVIGIITTETYAQSMRPSATLRWHLAFHLKMAFAQILY